MDIKPISEGVRITKEEAVKYLVMTGFLEKEAIDYLNESNARLRHFIQARVIKRVKGKDDRDLVT